MFGMVLYSSMHLMRRSASFSNFREDWFEIKFTTDAVCVIERDDGSTL